MIRSFRNSLSLLPAGALSFAALASPVPAQVTVRVSVGSSGAQANGENFYSSNSADGRFVAFWSDATNLVPGDTNGQRDVFVRDRQLGATERVSLGSAGAQGDAPSDYPSISPDGRFVSFTSSASNFVAGDTNFRPDIFVRDRQTGTTERVSVDSSGVEGNASSLDSSISGDGRYVAFRSFATNLVPGDTNEFPDMFVRDRQSGTTERVNLDSSGVPGNGGCAGARITPDGRYVAFHSDANNLVAGDTNYSDIFVRDRQLGTTERVSVDSSGAQANGSSTWPSISPDGRYVAFMSIANNFVPQDTNDSLDVFVRDRQLGTTERVSVDSSGAQGDNGGIGFSPDSYNPSISADGRYVAFQSYAANLVPGDTNGQADVIVRDRQSGTTERVSIDSSGAQGIFGGSVPSISADGRYVAFTSSSYNLVPGDTNGSPDIYVHDRSGGTDFTSLCDPGVGGVIACPCANPPSGAGRGCNNSSNTGGASLSASGGTFLTSDSLVFTTTGQRPTALSIVAQWNGVNPTGAIFGQGVRCTSGTLKRLFAKSASGGSITAPNFAGGDLTVSAASAAKGDPIAAGQSRWYVVYYRDNTVLGGCPALSNFNATQTGRVIWSP
ncbi:MAG: TolB family protein [Planctomycetota bacterium]